MTITQMAMCPDVPVPYTGTAGHWPQNRDRKRDKYTGHQFKPLTFAPFGDAPGGTVTGTKTGTGMSQEDATATRAMGQGERADKFVPFVFFRIHPRIL
jgi:hypothetical protein